MASLFPMFMKLAGRSCLVVGAGNVGEPKIHSLIEAGAKVRVVAPQATPTVLEWALSSQIQWEPRVFHQLDLDGVYLVIATTNSKTVNETIFLEAQARGILCNVVDDPEHCDFYYPAVARRGALQIAISTAGLSPALAQRLRKEFEAQFGPEYARWLEELGETRRHLFASDIEPEKRRQILHEIAGRDAFEASQLAQEKSYGR